MPAFSDTRYAELLRVANETERWPVDFRLSETPIFLTREFTEEISAAANEIVAQVRTPGVRPTRRESAIPPGLEVPNETPHPIFLQVDFAVCEEGGRLDAAPDRAAGLSRVSTRFQIFLLRCMRHAFPAIPAGLVHSFFGGLDEHSYLELLREVIVGDADPENVVLLEIEPEKQNTRIDFACTETLLGVAPVCLTDVTRRGTELFYHRDGREVRIERIYNRVIFDELLRRPDLKLRLQLPARGRRDMGRPSELVFPDQQTFSLPFLKTAHTSPAYFADEFPARRTLERLRA